MCSSGLIVEYSRMPVPSLSSGCEITHFFVRYMEIRQTHYHAIISCEFDRHISMLLSTREFDRHISMLLSTREFDRYIIMLSSSWLKLSSTATSACYYHLVSLSLPNEGFGRRNKRWNQIFEAIFKGVSTGFGLRTIEKSVENPDFLFCSSFQNLRLGSIKFDRHIGMPSSSCEFDRHIGMLSSCCDSTCELELESVRQTHNHAIIMLWVQPSHRHAIIMSRLCVRQTHRALYHHVVRSTDSSGHAIIMLWVPQTHRGHAIIMLWVRQTHRHAIIILWFWVTVRQTTHRHATMIPVIVWVRRTHRHATLIPVIVCHYYVTRVTRWW